MTRAVQYGRRIRAGVARLGAAITLTRAGDGSTHAISPIILPSVVTVTDGTSSSTTQQTTITNSQTAAGTAATALGTTSGTSALPTVLLLQDSGQTPSVTGDTFDFDGRTWTVQAVAYEYVQGVRVAYVSTATS